MSGLVPSWLTPSVQRVLSSVARQLFISSVVGVEGNRFPVTSTPAKGLLRTTFTVAGHKLVAVEQNPDKGSEWASKAREGHHVVQFMKEPGGQYVAVSVDGEVYVYGEK